MTGLAIDHEEQHPCTVVFEDGSLGPCEVLYLADLVGLPDLVSDDGRYPDDWPRSGTFPVRLITTGQGDEFEATLVRVE